MQVLILCAESFNVKVSGNEVEYDLQTYGYNTSQWCVCVCVCDTKNYNFQ